MGAAPAEHDSAVSLASLRRGARGVVVAVQNDSLSLGEEAESTVSRRLLELGFVVGEPVEIVNEVWPGRDPFAVRIGSTTFAIRRREAAAVMVRVAEH